MKNFTYTYNRVRVGALILFLAVVNLIQMNAAVILVPTDEATIQDAINAASPGDTVSLEFASSPFAEGLITIPSTKAGLVLQGNGSTINSSSGSWGLTIEADNVTIQDLTLNGAGTFGIITGNPVVGGNFLTLNSISVTGGGGSGFAITGVNDITMNNITSMNNGGNGISLTSVQNVVIDGYTSSGNMFGGGFSSGLGIFSCDSYSPCGADNIQLIGTVSIAEPFPIYSQEDVCGGTCGIGTVSNIILNPDNVSYTHLMGIDRDKFYFTSLSDALS
ncbi:MAG: hypothetical protein R3275_07880, partial [Saprospiraceae bacterium]|nr:hypothetical protein [Saprospiraceae bacterium]